MPMRPFLLLALALLVAGTPAAAQPAKPVPVPVRGTVVALDGHTLKVAARDGAQLSIALAPDYKVSGVVSKRLADIKPGDFVASTSVKGSDGKLHALEVHLLPETLRGVAREGQYPASLEPGSVMTNATAAGIAAAPQGDRLHVTWKDGAADVWVAPGTPIVAYIPGDASLLKPGAAIVTLAQRQADGRLTAARVTAEKDGVKPPM